MEHVILNRNPLCPFALGAILAFMLGIYQIPLEECEEMYRKLGSDVFKQNVIVGTMKMGWSHAFYDSEIWENVLKLVISFISFVVKIIRRNFSSPLYCSLILYFCLFVKGTHGRRLYDRECQGPTLPQSKLQPCFFFIVTYCFSHFNLINFSGSGNRHKPLFDSVDQKFQLIWRSRFYPLGVSSQHYCKQGSTTEGLCVQELQTHAWSEIPLPWRLQTQNVAGHQGLVRRPRILPGICPGKRTSSGMKCSKTFSARAECNCWDCEDEN